MIDIEDNKKESISELMQQGKTISDQDLNNLCYCFLELLEASLCIQYEICKVAEQQDNMYLKIIAEGFDNITKQTHHQFLQIKKQNQWDSNIGEKLI